MHQESVRKKYVASYQSEPGCQDNKESGEGMKISNTPDSNIALQVESLYFSSTGY
jgi:hypothetical protein